MNVETAAARSRSFNLSRAGVRELNAALHADEADEYRVLEPGGRHSIAAGASTDCRVTIEGHVGYYCAGMNQLATVRVSGNCGVGVAENMMSGAVFVEGDASQAAAATAHGGLLAIAGNASARCAISLKGADVVVRGSVGHMGGFMAQSGRLVVCGDAGEALGDSLYEARIYVRGTVASLGADCVEKEMRDEHRTELAELLSRAAIESVDPGQFRRYGSARKLYNFDVDDAGSYR